MSQLDPAMLSAKSFQRLTNLPHCATSILTQLQTGHISLCTFLKKIKAVDSALCLHCQKPETVSHYLLFCNKFTDAHCQLRFKVSNAATSLSKLLSCEKVIPHMLHYIMNSKRFENYTNISDSQIWQFKF